MDLMAGFNLLNTTNLDYFGVRERGTREAGGRRGANWGGMCYLTGAGLNHLIGYGRDNQLLKMRAHKLGVFLGPFP
jgi:hypothetical protein